MARPRSGVQRPGRGLSPGENLGSSARSSKTRRGASHLAKRIAPAFDSGRGGRLFLALEERG